MTGNALVAVRNDLPLLRKRLEGYRAMKVKIGPSTAPRRNTESWAGTNAELGEIHELDLHNWGYRSFLQFPLESRLGENLHGFHLDEEMLWDDPEAFPRALGGAARATIDEAFETGGWGRWTPLTKYTIEEKIGHGAKNPSQILVDTGELRESITFEITQ